MRLPDASSDPAERIADAPKGRAALADDAASERIDPLVWKIASVTLLGPLMTTIDSTVVNVSLATLGHELRTSLTTIQWVTSGYLLSLALMLPLSGWLVDRIGAKRVYLFCFTAFTVTSLLCGAANSATSLILFRVLQGVSGGLIAPMAQMMMARYAGRHVARVMGISVVPVMVGPILAPALAGAILQHAGWRWIFFVNLPIGVLATFLAWRILPRDSEETNPRAFDTVGFLLLSPALALLLHSLERLSAAPKGWFGEAELAASLVLLGAFLVHGKRRGRAALIDLSLFRSRTFSAAASTQFLSNCVSFGGQMLLPLYLLMVAGKSPAGAGILLAPIGLGMLCTLPLMGSLTERFGPRRVSSGGAFVALLGTLPFALFGATGLSPAALCVVLFIRGAGIGCINIPSISAAYSAIPKEVIPIATTAVNIVQRLGGPVATTFLAISLHFGLQVRKMDAPHAFVATFWMLCVLHALVFLSALRLPERIAHRERPPGKQNLGVAEVLGE